MQALDPNWSYEESDYELRVDADADSAYEELVREQLKGYVAQRHADECVRRTGRLPRRLQIKIPRHVEDTVFDRLWDVDVECDEDGEYIAEETLGAALAYAFRLKRMHTPVVRPPLLITRCRPRPRGRRVRRSARSPGQSGDDGPLPLPESGGRRPRFLVAPARRGAT